MDKTVKIRDLRIKEKYQLDDAYLNGYARLCGWKATLVYNSLCRHADKDQYSFPSIELMAQQHGVSRDTIIDGIKSLQEWNIISVFKERTKGGTWRNNGYTLVDKSEWKPKPSPSEGLDEYKPPSRSQRHGKPSRPQLHDQVANSDTKDTHKKETHNNDKENGTFPESSLRRLLRTDTLNENTNYINKILQCYLYFYEKRLGKEHPHLKSEQLGRIKHSIDAFDKEWGMDFEQWVQMISHWFTLPIDSDYNLNHFTSEEILQNRYYEVVY